MLIRLSSIVDSHSAYCNRCQHSVVCLSVSYRCQLMLMVQTHGGYVLKWTAFTCQLVITLERQQLPAIFQASQLHRPQKKNL